MAEGQITVRIPGASPPIPDVVIQYFLGDDDYALSLEGLVSVSGRSTAGTPAITGPLVESSLIRVAGALPEEDALRLGALVQWSNTEYKAKRDGHLELDFEIEYADPQPSPYPKALVATLTTPYGYEYGFPRYNVLLTLPENYRKRLGCMGGVPYSVVRFIATEV